MKLFIGLFCSLVFSINIYAKGFLPIANIVKIQGKAFIDKEEVKVGAEVAQGMTIKIPKKGDYLVVKFQNGHLVRFNEATVKVEELTEKVSLLHLIKGQLYSLVKTLTPDEKFMLKTKHASFAVRGTKFGLSIDEKKKKTYLCVCEGIVEASKDNMSTKVHKHEDLWVGAKAKNLESAPSSEKMDKMTNQMFEGME